MTDSIEKQALLHYQRPFLRVDQIARQSDAGRLELQQGERRLILTVESGDFDAISEILEELRDPDSVCWIDVRAGPDPDLSELVDKFDRLGWLGEASLAGRMRVNQETSELRELMRRGTEWLIEAASCRDGAGETAFPGGCFVGTLARFAEQVATLLGEAPTATASSHFPDPGFQRGIDLAGEALSLMLGRWRRTSPLALRLTHTLFGSALRYLTSTHHEPCADLGDYDLSTSDPSEASKQIWAAMLLLILSSSGRYRSDYMKFVPQGDLAGPGLGVLIEAEVAAEHLVSARGPSSLLRLLGRGAGLKRATINIYLHQYFITMRFSEAMFPLLEHRLPADLKGACTQHLLEEIGHEVHELEACRELGVTYEEVSRFAPLPFFSAYLDVLGGVAEIDPLASLLAVSVAEGLPGSSGKPLVRALKEQGIYSPKLAAHQNEDERLDHTYVTRRLMQHIPWVESEAARRSISRFLLIVDLSQLCWRELASYAEASDVPTVPVTFGMSAETVLNTFAGSGAVLE